MKYFTDEIHDIEGYHQNLLTLDKWMNKAAFEFFCNDSFHDSRIIEIKALNNYDEDIPDDTKESIVSVQMILKYWDGSIYELLWKDVTKYQIDFDIARNIVVESGQILFKEGFEQWSHAELTETPNNRLQHEIASSSRATMMIECGSLSLKKCE